MRTVLNAKAVLTIALVLAGEFTGVAKSVAGGSPEASSTITICVHNYAQADDATLQEAEKVVAGIFRKVGVATRWIAGDLPQERKEQKSPGDDTSGLSRIHLRLLPAAMAESFDLPDNAMGLTPGFGTDRQTTYVFYNRVEVISQKQMRARYEKKMDIIPSKSAILGYAIAHELGHVLLNLEGHSATGIMRGGWNRKDLKDIALGSLSFTAEQAEFIRTEALRRNMRRESLEGAKVESPAETRPVS